MGQQKTLVVTGGWRNQKSSGARFLKLFPLGGWEETRLVIGGLETWLAKCLKIWGNSEKVCVLYISVWLMVAVFITCLLVHSLAANFLVHSRPRPLWEILICIKDRGIFPKMIRFRMFTKRTSGSTVNQEKIMDQCSRWYFSYWSTGDMHLFYLCLFHYGQWIRIFVRIISITHFWAESNLMQNVVDFPYNKTRLGVMLHDPWNLTPLGLAAPQRAGYGRSQWRSGGRVGLGCFTSKVWPNWYVNFKEWTRGNPGNY